MPRGIYTRKRRPIRDRYFEKVDQRGPEECWPWTGSKNSDGYGQFMLASHGGVDDVVGAHRVALFFATGIWPRNDTRHSCDNPVCQNPAHLTPGTRAENMADMIAKGRSLRGESQPRHKLSWSQVREARRRHAAGVRAAELAADYEVSLKTMSQCLAGTTWLDPDELQSPEVAGVERT